MGRKHAGDGQPLYHDAQLVSKGRGAEGTVGRYLADEQTNRENDRIVYS